MDRMINYQITENADGLRIEQFLRHQCYSYRKR
jgi:23S rRNA pseudouridine1911/1915/1917 synthase